MTPEGSTVSCKRGQLGFHNKTIHLCNEVVFPEKERLAGWMADGPTSDSEGGGGGRGGDRGTGD